MPSIFMSPDGESWDSVCPEWQSEFIEANAQERSHAAASGDTDKSSATIEPANVRLMIMPISMLRQSLSLFQYQESRCIGPYSSTKIFSAGRPYLVLLFSAQTYS